MFFEVMAPFLFGLIRNGRMWMSDLLCECMAMKPNLVKMCESFSSSSSLTPFKGMLHIFFPKQTKKKLMEGFFRNFK